MSRRMRSYYYALLGALGGLIGWQVSDLLGLSFASNLYLSEAVVGALVGLSSAHSPNLALLGLLIITPTKASLVLFYFMHLKYEKAGLKYMVTTALAVLVIFIFLTFSDYLFR